MDRLSNRFADARQLRSLGIRGWLAPVRIGRGLSIPKFQGLAAGWIRRPVCSCDPSAAQRYPAASQMRDIFYPWIYTARGMPAPKSPGLATRSEMDCRWLADCSQIARRLVADGSRLGRRWAAAEIGIPSCDPDAIRLRSSFGPPSSAGYVRPWGTSAPKSPGAEDRPNLARI